MTTIDNAGNHHAPNGRFTQKPHPQNPDLDTPPTNQPQYTQTSPDEWEITDNGTTYNIEYVEWAGRGHYRATLPNSQTTSDSTSPTDRQQFLKLGWGHHEIRNGLKNTWGTPPTSLKQRRGLCNSLLDPDQQKYLNLECWSQIPEPDIFDQRLALFNRAWETPENQELLDQATTWLETGKGEKQLDCEITAKETENTLKNGGTIYALTQPVEPGVTWRPTNLEAINNVRENFAMDSTWVFIENDDNQVYSAEIGQDGQVTVYNRYDTRRQAVEDENAFN